MIFWKVYMAKCGLVSESFSLWLKSQKKVLNHSPEHLLFRWIVLTAQRCVLSVSFPLDLLLPYY